MGVDARSGHVVRGAARWVAAATGACLCERLEGDEKRKGLSAALGRLVPKREAGGPLRGRRRTVHPAAAAPAAVSKSFFAFFFSRHFVAPNPPLDPHGASIYPCAESVRRSQHLSVRRIRAPYPWAFVAPTKKFTEKKPVNSSYPCAVSVRRIRGLSYPCAVSVRRSSVRLWLPKSHR